MKTPDALFVCEPDSDPYYNMACDAALFGLLAGTVQEFSAVLRLYSWGHPAITVGYNQDISRALDVTKVEKELPVIRRITGGRAIYHDRSEITFSLTLRADKFQTGVGNISKMNTMISEVLVKVLNSHGIAAEWRRHSDDKFKRFGPTRIGACFASVSRYEIVSHGVKIVGGAQRQSGGSFIHQGSVKLNGIASHPALDSMNIGASKPHENDNIILISDIKEAFIRSFSRRFQCGFDEGEFPPKLADAIKVEEKKLRQNPLLDK